MENLYSDRESETIKQTNNMLGANHREKQGMGCVLYRTAFYTQVRDAFSGKGLTKDIGKRQEYLRRSSWQE